MKSQHHRIVSVLKRRAVLIIGLSIGLLLAAAYWLFPQIQLQLPLYYSIFFVVQGERKFLGSAKKAEVEMLGSHFVVSCELGSEVETLVSRGAIGGVYINRDFAASRSVEELHTYTGRLQEIARSNHHPPLLIAADQEGGAVSHLSPPLTRRTNLRGINSTNKGNSVNEAFQLGQDVGRELKSIGVNVNFSPVVDVLENSPETFFDPYTKLNVRAIGDNPEIVSALASAYSKGLSAAGVLPVLKHFPGLGSVNSDTHLLEGVSGKSQKDLEERDWIPFHSISAEIPVGIMVGHIRVPSLDAKSLASTSPVVMRDILRDQLHFKGIVFTDDFCMGPIINSPEGIGESTVRALNSGADIVLFSWRGQMYYPAMASALRALKAGKLDVLSLDTSRLRIKSATDRWKKE